jgi:hypothetical protein
MDSRSLALVAVLAAMPLGARGQSPPATVNAQRLQEHIAGLSQLPAVRT